MSHAVRFGIDLGGTKTEILAIDPSGKEVLRVRTATPNHEANAIFQNIASMVRSAEQTLGMTGPVGIATPGSLSPETGLMRNSNTTVLNKLPVQKEIEARLGRPIRMANDANCFALSEAVDGAAAGASVVFGVIIGTGCGAGVVIDGKILNGLNGVAGEFGHNPLPWPHASETPGMSCYCGKFGCLETWISGPFIAKHFNEETGGELNTAQIASMAETGDAKCNRAMKQLEDRIARALATVVNLIDPDVIVLGGGVSNIARLYENVPKLLPRYVFSDVIRTKIVKAKHGDSSGVRGAAWLNPL